MGKGFSTFLDHFWGVNVKSPSIELVLVVSKFYEVFSLDLMIIPPNRDIPFYIELEMGTHPIFIFSYRTALVEL